MRSPRAVFVLTALVTSVAGVLGPIRVTFAGAPGGLPGVVDCTEESGPHRVTFSLGTAASAAPTGDPATVGAWTAPFDVGLSAIHASVLPSGKVQLFSYPDPAPGKALGSEAVLFDPATGTVEDASLGVEKDLFCAAHSFLPDGRLFTTGGHEKGTSNKEERGIRETFLFDPVANSWAAGPVMERARWYPSNVPLADGRTLIFAGRENQSSPVNFAESYNPVTNALTRLPASADKGLPLYPRMHQLRNGKILLSGPARGTQFFDPATNTWSWVGNKSTSRNNGNSVVLPGGDKVMAVGGNDAGGPLATAEIIDFSVSKPAWRPTGSMTYPRKHANAVLLPDGKVLVVGGGRCGSYDCPVRESELYDLATGTWSVVASQQADRIYHSTAVLLPDGRVLAGGSDASHNALSQTAEIYSPPYLFAGPRPSIASAPSAVAYGASFAVDTPDRASVDRVALIRPGSVTHSTDFNQRFVYLPFTAPPEGNGLVVTAPATANDAPPGDYMLFLVAGGVPSVASWVRVG